MVAKGVKTAAEAARLFKVHPATVSRLLARASFRGKSVTSNGVQTSKPNILQRDM
jgi:hypothetical protein